MSKYRKPPRPRPNRSMSLWKGCIFAYAAGWEKGYNANVPETAGEEDQWRWKGDWVGSLDDTNYIEMDMGRVLDEGLSDDRLEFSDVGNRYDTNGFISAAVLTRPDNIQNGEQAIFSKQDGPAPGNGWGITVSFGGDPNPNGWHFQINDGAVREMSIANEQNTARTDLLIMTYNRSDLRGFINGALRGTVAATGAIVNNDHPVRLFGDAIQANYQGSIGMTAAWNRPLTNSEIAKLYSDPYIMWRYDLHKEFMFGNVGGARAFQTFHLNFG